MKNYLETVNLQLGLGSKPRITPGVEIPWTPVSVLQLGLGSKPRITVVPTGGSYSNNTLQLGLGSKPRITVEEDA